MASADALTKSTPFPHCCSWSSANSPSSSLELSSSSSVSNSSLTKRVESSIMRALCSSDWNSWPVCLAIRSAAMPSPAGSSSPPAPSSTRGILQHNTTLLHKTHGHWQRKWYSAIEKTRQCATNLGSQCNS